MSTRTMLPIQARLYLSSSQAWSRVLKLCECFRLGFWLGILDRSSLQAIDEAYYDNLIATSLRGSGIDYTGSEHNLRGLFPWEETAVKTHFPAASSVLVIGAGGGREVIALQQLGYGAE